MQKKNNDTDLQKIGPMITKNKLGKVVCRHPWTSFDIYPNGNVTPCCYLPKRVMGNMNNESIEEIRNGEKFKALRKKMSVEGAQNACPLCPVQLGMNHWETLEWYANIDKDSKVYKNAVLNEQEIWEGKTELKSSIRRLKYTPRYTCNLNCYHCCQDQYRLHGFEELNKSILEKVSKIFPTLQIINPFGGEPFIFQETYKLMDVVMEINPNCQLYTTTNANHFTDKTVDYLRKINIGKIAVSIDGFSKETYEKYRKKGKWDVLLKNIEFLANLKKEKFFIFIFNASFNNETYKEIPEFIDLCKKYGATGKLVLLQYKSNHGKDFWRKHIKMSRNDLIEFKQLVDKYINDNTLPIDTKNSLINMKRELRHYPYSEFQILKNNHKAHIVNILNKLKLYNLVYPAYKKLIK
jgi:radical SAM protein with 4Fe4S-binding SPASM domain